MERELFILFQTQVHLMLNWEVQTLALQERMIYWLWGQEF